MWGAQRRHVQFTSCRETVETHLGLVIARPPSNLHGLEQVPG